MSKMVLINTITMRNLLQALKISTMEYHVDESGFIELDINAQQLYYRINASSEAIQHIFGKTDEWKQLTDFFRLMNG